MAERNTWAEKKRILEKQGEWYDCPYCLNTIHLSEGDVDHIEPWSITHTNNIKNLLLVCASCNKSKSNKVLVYWLIENKVSPERVYWHLKANNKWVPKSMLEYLGFEN